MQEVLVTIIGSLALSMWGLNLWEIRKLRVVVAELTLAVIELKTEMGHKASDVALSVVEHELDGKVDK